MKRNDQARVGLGIPSLVLILLVLCLALLGVLALISARADRQMAMRQAELAMTYAQASAKMESAFAELDRQMAECWKNSASEAEYALACETIDEAAGINVTWQDEAKAWMAVEAGSSVLQAAIRRMDWENAKEKRFEILQYALENAENWEQTESLNLMDI